VVEHLPHTPTVKGSSTDSAAGTGRENDKNNFELKNNNKKRVSKFSAKMFYSFKNTLVQLTEGLPLNMILLYNN